MFLLNFSANNSSPAHTRRESPDRPDLPPPRQQNHHNNPSQHHAPPSHNQYGGGPGGGGGGQASALFGALKGGALGFMGKVKNASSMVMEGVSA